MIEHGPDIKSQLDNVSTKSDLALAQLLMFNYHPNSQKVTVQQRQSADRETPFCVSWTVTLAKIRKTQLGDTLFQHGICISYDRVLEISTQLGEAVVERYLDEGVAVTPEQHLPSPGDWGWVKENADGLWIPHWTQLAAIAASCQELQKVAARKLVLVDLSVTKLA
ncbi:unnamed protein product [Mytilus coruscus]|uniref:Uncharacterized protein n=1 Tax=Mytilus coruscus TaxID=42192 RepID=A0A6J8DH37_MYTCO|nr:unnamed protein product [Mytilus coruscus]